LSKFSIYETYAEGTYQKLSIFGTLLKIMLTAEALEKFFYEHFEII